MLQRDRELATLRGLLRRHPVVGIIGARQVGKTTLARALMRGESQPTHRFDLENPEDLARLAEPMLVLKSLRGLVVIDEIQRHPDLFKVLRVLADRPRHPCRFPVLGSAAPELLKQTSETLAGRIAYHQLSGFAVDEVGTSNLDRLWRRGGLPPSYLARSEQASFEWRRGFVRTFVERDLPQLGVNISSATMHRFWAMLAHYRGQVWNASEFARSFGVADTSVRGYLDRELRSGGPATRSLARQHRQAASAFPEGVCVGQWFASHAAQSSNDGGPRIPSKIRCVLGGLRH